MQVSRCIGKNYATYLVSVFGGPRTSVLEADTSVWHADRIVPGDPGFQIVVELQDYLHTLCER